MKIFKIPSIWPFSFYQEKPTAIRVFPCPACKETISADANNCRFCHLPIDAATAERLLLENQRVTNAVAGANTLRLSISLAALVILWWIIGVLTKDPSPAVFLPLVGIGYGALWLYRYGSLTTSDVDYPLAVKRVKRTTLIWLLALVLPWGISKLSVPEHRLVTQETVEFREVIHLYSYSPALEASLTSASACSPKHYLRNRQTEFRLFGRFFRMTFLAPTLSR